MLTLTPTFFCRNRNILHKVRIDMLRFPINMRRLCRNQASQLPDAGITAVGHKCCRCWMQVFLPTDINIYRDRHWCLSRQMLIPLAPDVDIHEAECPQAAFPAFFPSSLFVNISLSCWLSARWAFPVPFFPTGCTHGRKQPILRQREIQIVRRDGRNDKKTKGQQILFVIVWFR